jgi:5'-methylthioadenosine phosphorylase
MEGPQFSTLAESLAYKARGLDVIGMTAATEAKLAREAELPYAAVAMVTDYDCWHEEHGPVDVASVLRIVRLNAERVEALLTRALEDFPAEHEPCPSGADRALDGAIMTHPDARDPELMNKLEAIVARALAAAR